MFMDQQQEQSNIQPSSHLEAVLVPADGVEKVWVLAEGFVEAACKTTDKQTPSSVFDGLIEDKCQLWLVYDVEEGEVISSVITEICCWPSGTWSALITLCGGLQVNRWAPLIAKIEDWARSEGCHAVEVLGRKGWARIFRDMDYTPSEFWVRKEL